MKVAELIKELQKYDDNLEITLFDDNAVPYKIKNVYLCETCMRDTNREGDVIPRNFCPNYGEKITEEEKDDG